VQNILNDHNRGLNPLKVLYLELVENPKIKPNEILFMKEDNPSKYLPRDQIQQQS